MSRGTPTPQPIIDFILEKAKDAPGLSAARIAVMVEGKFRQSIDKSTVSRLLNNAGLGSNLAANDPVSEPVNNDAAMDDQIRQVNAAHETDLLDLIQQLSRSVQEFPPVPYFVGHALGDFEIKVRLPDRASPVWESLEEHLTGDAVWNLLGVWESEASHLTDAMHHIEEFAITRGKQEFNAPVMSTTPAEGARLTTAFPIAVEETVLAWALHDGEILPDVHLSVDRPGSLLFRSNTNLTERVDLDDDELKRRFTKILQSAWESEHGKSVRTSIMVIGQAAEPLVRRLETLWFRHSVPGTCVNLCSDSVIN